MKYCIVVGGLVYSRRYFNERKDDGTDARKDTSFSRDGSASKELNMHSIGR